MVKRNWDWEWHPEEDPTVGLKDGSKRVKNWQWELFDGVTGTAEDVRQLGCQAS